MTFWALPLACVALDGSRDVFVSAPTNVDNGWKTFEIISGQLPAGQNPSDVVPLGARAVEGFDWVGDFEDWDGLGAYRHDSDTLRIFVNHETGSDSTFTRVDVDVPSLKAWIVAGIPNNSNSNQVAPVSDVVEAVSRGWLGVGSGSDPINNPCSGNVWLADTFGSGLGFIDSVYLTGEEVFSPRDGHIWVMDLATRLLYEAPDLGEGSWENATLIDTGRADTIALLLSEDNDASATGTAPIVLYVGLKNPSSPDFLTRNGLVGGQLYYWHADSAGTNGTLSGIFSAGNGTTIAGTWQSSATGAALISKSEDLHVNMDKDSEGYGMEVALASQDEAVFLIDCASLGYVAGDLAAAARSSTIRVLYEASTQAASNDFADMDNIVWSPDGQLYINEDDGEGDVWTIDVASLLASYDSGDTTPDANQVYQILDADGVAESSGIIDISEAIDYVPGSVFLVSGHSPDVLKNQIAMCVSPSAQLKADVYADWALGYPALDSAAKRLPAADPDADGLDNATEFALGLLPDTPETESPLTLDRLTASTSATFTAARSLDLVDYYLDYTEDLSAGFTHTITIRAAHVGASGDILLTLPKADQLFARIRATLP